MKYTHSTLLFAILFLATALALSSASRQKIKEPLTFDEKERIAKDMKKIAQQLDVKCEYCHTDAERGLKEGDFTLLTKEGEYAHEEMFPLSRDFKVECKFCHLGGEDLTEAGSRARRDMKFIRRMKREQRKVLACKSCHIPGPAGEEFAKLTATAKKLMP